MKNNHNNVSVPLISRFLNIPITGRRFISAIFLSVAVLLVSGCKKNNADDISYYGYGKLTVECEKKCHVTFGEGDKLNDFDVEGTTATYVFRYQSKYDIDIKITPVETQNIVLNVYSREGRQIFRNNTSHTGGVLWENIILVP